MKSVSVYCLLFSLGMLSFFVNLSYGQDMRAAQIQAQQQKAALLGKAAAEKKAAEAEAARSREQILKDRTRLEKAMPDWKNRLKPWRPNTPGSRGRRTIYRAAWPRPTASCANWWA